MPRRRTATIAFAGLAAAGAVAVALALGDRADDTPARSTAAAALASADVTVNAPEGAGMGIWSPRTLADAVAGSDATVTARVLSRGPGPGLEGLPARPGLPDPPVLPTVQLELQVEQVMHRAGWAREVPGVVPLHVLAPEQGGLGLERGGQYVFFLAERDSVVGGDPRTYDTAWEGAYMPIVDGKIAAEPDSTAPGTRVGDRPATLEELAAAVQRAADDRGLAAETHVEASPNPYLQTRAETRRRFDYPEVP